MLRRAYWPCLTILLLPLVSGCEGEQAYGVVEGVVTLDGKPLANAEVVFMPDPEKGTKGRRSVALTDKDGRYHIASDNGREGAPVGHHRVVINDLLLGPPGGIRPDETPQVVLPDDEKKGPVGTTPPPNNPAPNPKKKKSRFPEAYSNTNDTPLRDIEVKPGTQTIDLPLKN